jgi:ATP-dependent Zn protease
VQAVLAPEGRAARRNAAVILATCLLFATPAFAQTAPTTTESYQALLGQINGHQVRSATINRKAHTVKATLDDGSVQRVDYPPAEERTLSDNLRKSGATVKIAKKKKAKKAVHHKLRYIAAGIVGFVVVVGLVLLILRGRRPPEPVHEGQPAPTAPPPEDKPQPPADAAQ